jgi:subtilisin family serine protease
MNMFRAGKYMKFQDVASSGRRGVTRCVAALLAAVSLLAVAVPASAAPTFKKLDPELNRQAGHPSGTTQVIVRLAPGAGLPGTWQQYVRGARLTSINAVVLQLPNALLPAVDTLPEVVSAHHDRPAWAADYLSTRSTGASVVQQAYGFTGRGVGVAVIDSGITPWHDDLTPTSGGTYPYGSQRVSTFVDLVNGRTLPYDDHGHGSHVSGIILGNGADSLGRQVGIAPEAALVSLKVLDSQGKGTISTIISALDWVAANAQAYNIRVVNLSVGASVTQSYLIDPLALAAKGLTDRGIVVVAAAGNLGKNASGQQQYGGILAPGNAPWVLTVGASSTQGTTRRQDDIVADFSSLGPTRGDYLAKPDIVAPGYGVISLAVPGSTLYQSSAQYLVSGAVPLAYEPYLSLSGTSMAAPQVSGAVALMLQANPVLTPNLVKATLQYTAQAYQPYNPLQQGAGFLDVLSAVRLARFYAVNRPGSRMPVQNSWSQHIVWGNQLISGGYLNPLGNAWATNIVWGTALANTDNIVWGTLCSRSCDNVVWGTADATGANIVWGTAAARSANIVWGTTSADNIVWGTGAAANIVWGTSGGASSNIVWGTGCGGDNCTDVVWGAANSAGNIVWGTASATHNIVWGTADNIVWGTLADNGNIVWGTLAGSTDNIVWGTSADNGNVVWGAAANANIVWGTASADNIVWGTADNIVWGTAENSNLVWGTSEVDDIVWNTGSYNANTVWDRGDVDLLVWGTGGIFGDAWGRW